jgi:hypothetical protein
MTQAVRAAASARKFMARQEHTDALAAVRIDLVSAYR